ncbi:hypothetical protein HanRHA438_Chr11g0528571 [Helianthus annuus]|uniref:Uncharacterized protein n=1 Tax=Helianthus annuus TaxID=4232 RepID=A0A9K3N2M6_HELAN|nr:hypothetical protein HanXRQr2_Chr11g0516851 [Helianthus annuus]KAJ0511759.1 hypothetical protein HanIR_Chr11g0555671 [Helianthus annuus]KAJ0519382.1 hypothetical protein HanHA89_Chr11g0448131 [Helianthus annuus]KAJ0872863.1 hypothetical protein HanRHA438_Chr11g0528571 [Helianthus annuus]KAJ0877276.1 hypothetical protein HanPSC8_Chr11g0498221 [Helianthus annuus]
MLRATRVPGSGSDDDSGVLMRDMMEWTHVVCDGGIACLGSNTSYDNKEDEDVYCFISDTCDCVIYFIL